MNKYLMMLVLVTGSSSHAYRDLETGTFLTRDPIGYGDGPNVYCYVHNNPITQFDPLGLEFKLAGTEAQKEIAGGFAVDMYQNASPEIQGKIDAYIESDTVITIVLVENDSRIMVGGYDDSQVDLGDIQSLPEKDAPLSQTAAFGHEIMEQAYKQTEGLKNIYDENGQPIPGGMEDYEKADAEGVKAEEDLNGGYKRSSARRDWEDGKRQAIFVHKNDTEAVRTTLTETEDGGMTYKEERVDIPPEDENK